MHFNLETLAKSRRITENRNGNLLPRPASHTFYLRWQLLNPYVSKPDLYAFLGGKLVNLVIFGSNSKHLLLNICSILEESSPLHPWFLSLLLIKPHVASEIDGKMTWEPLEPGRTCCIASNCFLQSIFNVVSHMRLFHIWQKRESPLHAKKESKRK